jgi:hypothetical protein
MARPAEELPSHPALAVIERAPIATSFDDWLADLHDDGGSAVGADAAELLRELRHHGEL